MRGRIFISAACSTWTASATQAVAEYKQALENRDGQQDTRLAAERGVKAAYAVKGHSPAKRMTPTDAGRAASADAKPGQGQPACQSRNNRREVRRAAGRI